MKTFRKEWNIIEDSKEIMEEMKSDELMEKREEEKQRSCNIV